MKSQNRPINIQLSSIIDVNASYFSPRYPNKYDSRRRPFDQGDAEEQDDQGDDKPVVRKPARYDWLNVM